MDGKERHDAEMAEIREKARRDEERFNREDQLFHRRLDRLARLSAQEDRRERRLRRVEPSLAEAAIASLAQTVDRFIQARQNGGNRNPKP